MRIVHLHGHGDEPGRSPGLVLFAGDAVATPRGPLEAAGGAAWYEPGDPASAPLAAGRDTVVAAMHTATAAGDEVLLAGYSQGAALTVAYLLSGTAPRPSAAVIANGWLPAELDPTHAVPTLDLPILVVHGTDDEVVDPMAGRAAARLLSRKGAAVVWHEVPGEGHHLGPDAAEVVTAWLAEVRSGRRPGHPLT
ncbi:MAG: prolyl oligopeptidase family serine peptidase [Acidimicrobiia bacterium]|nr:prolyl oligopeptidase family serine peptidase [Acidimicrobiia bacterium]